MSALISLLGWNFLPDLISSLLQTTYYSLTTRASSPKPLPGTPLHALHRRRIRILVTTIYLLYTVYQADHDLARHPTYYADLGLPATATDRDVKSRFRRLAAVHHPDKTGGNPSGSVTDDAAAYFMHLKRASDTLQDAARRFAYERFGTAITAWDRCVTVRDYVHRGVLNGILPHYGAAAAVVYVLGLFGHLSFGRFYRWLLLVGLCLFEVHAVTRPDVPPLLRAVNAVRGAVSSREGYLPFQFIELLRGVSLTGYIALSQLGPLLVRELGPASAAAVEEDEDEDEDEEKALRESLAALEAVAAQLDGDAGRLVDVGVAPFRGDAASVGLLRGHMREWLVQNTIRADPMVRDALRTSLVRRRRGGGGGGAKRRR